MGTGLTGLQILNFDFGNVVTRLDGDGDGRLRHRFAGVQHVHFDVARVERCVQHRVRPVVVVLHLEGEVLALLRNDRHVQFT